MSLHHLPKEALYIAGQQGWNEDSVLIHLLGFIRDNVPDADVHLANYFQSVAAEENAAMLDEEDE